MISRNNNGYVQQGEFLALRNVTPDELAEITKTLESKLGKYTEPFLSVPGLEKRRIYSGMDPKTTNTRPWMDIWTDASDAGQCAYVTASSEIHDQIEQWGRAKKDHKHITAYGIDGLLNISIKKSKH